MNRADVRELSVYRGYPCLSLFIDLAYEKHRVDKLHEWYGKAKAQMKEGFPEFSLPDEHALQTLVDITQPVCKTLAIFINKYVVRGYVLPFRLADEIVCDMSFAIQRVTNTLNRTEHYWLLVLDKYIPQLFEGYEQGLIAVSHRHNESTGESVYAVDDAAGKVCDMPLQTWEKGCRYTSQQEFFASVDRYLKHFLDGSQVPLVVVANQQTTDAFKQYSCYGSEALLSHVLQDLWSLEQLAKDVWPLVQAYHNRQRVENVKALKQALRANLCAIGAEAVWKAAREDQIRLLCVEKDAHILGCKEISTCAVQVGPSCEPTQQSIDIVDEILELAANKGIPITLYADGALADYQSIAAIVRG